MKKREKRKWQPGYEKNSNDKDNRENCQNGHTKKTVQLENQ